MHTPDGLPEDAAAAGGAVPAELPVADGHQVERGTQAVGATFDEGQGRVFPCESCGADLQFHIGMQSLTCPWCGHVKEIVLAEESQVVEQDFHAMLEQVLQWREAARQRAAATADAADAGSVPGGLASADDREALREIRCHACGGNIEFVGTLTSTACPYCSSPVQLEDAHRSTGDRIAVDGVLPFQIDRRVAKRNLADWVSSRWFAPNDFRRQGAEGRFNGIYLSYFTFDTMTATAYSGMRGEHYYVTVGSGKNRRSERRTRWYPASGNFQRFFDDVLVLANTGLRRDFMLDLEPWPLDKVVPFNQQMLAGFLARTYDMELDTCFNDARSRVDAAIHTEVCQRIGGDTQQVSSVNTRCEAITFKHLLLPAWLMAYQYRDRTYQIFINAATGEVNGERPYSAWKIAGAVLAALLLVGVVAASAR